MWETLRSDPLVRMLGHTTLVLFLLTLAFFVLPLRFDWADDASLWRLAVSVTVLALLVAAFRLDVRWSANQGRRYLRIQWLLTALYALVLTFALVYAAIAAYWPQQFVGIEDRTDALYFSVTLVATVGFGDIHPAGNVGQMVATVHMLFNLIYLGTALRVLTGSFSVQSPPDDED